MSIQLPPTTPLRSPAIGEGPAPADAAPAAAPGSQPARAWNIGLPAAPGDGAPGARASRIGAELFQHAFPNANLADVLRASASDLLKRG